MYLLLEWEKDKNKQKEAVIGKVLKDDKNMAHLKRPTNVKCHKFDQKSRLFFNIGPF